MRRDTATALLSCLAAIVSGLAPAAAAEPDRPVAATPGEVVMVLDVRLSMAASLPERTRVSLTQEADAIWRREGVRLAWGPASTAHDRLPPDALRVVVAQQGTGTSTGEHRWRVGELLLDQSERAVAIASIEAAERVLTSAVAVDEPVTLRDHRLGVILGRALAHEIGHHLLKTPGHASRGLMRARIGAGELADLRSGAFFLDAAAARWIREARTSLVNAPMRLARFDYEP